MSSEIDLNGEGEQNSNSNLIRNVIQFCGGPDLIEVFGDSGSGKTEFAIEVANSAINDANKDVLFIDTERNIGEMDRIDGADYVYIPDWHDLYEYVVGVGGGADSEAFGFNSTDSTSIQPGYDVVVLDSIGFPALIQYGKYRVDDDSDQFKVFNEIQVITGELKKYAQMNDSLVLVTNQPKSDLSDANEPNPFGDKAIFGFKEIWKTYKESSSQVKTSCVIKAFRSRQAGRGKKLFEMEVDDSGTDIQDVSDPEDEANEFLQ